MGTSLASTFPPKLLTLQYVLYICMYNDLHEVVCVRADSLGNAVRHVLPRVGT